MFLKETRLSRSVKKVQIVPFFKLDNLKQYLKWKKKIIRSSEKKLKE
jgi:hypothetical protein